MKKEQVDLDNWVVHIADSETANGIGDMPLTAAAREAFQRQMEEANGREYLFPSPKQNSRTPYMTNLLKGWARDPQESWRAVFYSLRSPAHVRNSPERRRCRRSHGDADAATGRCRSLQAVQPGQARHDARGPGEAGSRCERTVVEFSHGPGQLRHFIHIFSTVETSGLCGGRRPTVQ